MTLILSGVLGAIPPHAVTQRSSESLKKRAMLRGFLLFFCCGMLKVCLSSQSRFTVQFLVSIGGLARAGNTVFLFLLGIAIFCAHRFCLHFSSTVVTVNKMASSDAHRILIPEMFHLVVQFLDTCSAIKLHNTCRQFANSCYTQLIRHTTMIALSKLPRQLASYVHCVQPTSIRIRTAEDVEEFVRLRLQDAPLFDEITTITFDVLHFKGPIPVVKFPPSVTCLHCTAPLPVLPQGLQELKIGRQTFRLCRGQLPESLQRFATSTLDQGMDHNALPDGITHLLLGPIQILSNQQHELEQRPQVNWPSAMRFVRMYLTHHTTEIIASKIAALPDSVEELQICDIHVNLTVHKWPKGLRRLRLILTFKHSRYKFDLAPFPAEFETLYVDLHLRDDWRNYAELVQPDFTPTRQHHFRQDGVQLHRSFALSDLGSGPTKVSVLDPHTCL
jgi:hypothetical protein